MNFYIKQYSNYPVLKFPLTQRIMEKYNITHDMMENVAVTFSMYNEDEGEYEIANNGGDLFYRDKIEEIPYEDRYTLIYKFNKIETNKVGRYSGEFKLTFLEPHCGIITLPNNEYINIYISKSETKVDIV